MPPWDESCKNVKDESVIFMIYPESDQILIPTKHGNGVLGKVVFRAAHQQSNKTIYWHVDEEFVGQTDSFHELALTINSGHHALYLVDELGNELTQSFEVVFPD